MALVALALFVTLALFVALVFVVVTALIVAISFADCCELLVVYPNPSPRRRKRTTPHLRRHGLDSAASSSASLLGCFSLADASPMKTWFIFAPSHPHCCWTIVAQRCNISLESNSISSLEALVGESPQTKEKAEKVYFYLRLNF